MTDTLQSGNLNFEHMFGSWHSEPPSTFPKLSKFEHHSLVTWILREESQRIGLEVLMHTNSVINDGAPYQEDETIFLTRMVEELLGRAEQHDSVAREEVLAYCLAKPETPKKPNHLRVIK
jgi:hypothetical protein